MGNSQPVKRQVTKEARIKDEQREKIYCIASFAFGVCGLILTITLCMMHPGRVYVKFHGPDSITKITQKDTQGADHNTDNANGLSITYNNDSGSVSTPIKMLLVLTILSLAPSILIMMTSFTRIIIVLHFLRTAIGTQTTPPQSGFDRSGIVSDIFYHVANVPADQQRGNSATR